jgi:hypothetical protein
MMDLCVDLCFLGSLPFPQLILALQQKISVAIELLAFYFQHGQLGLDVF